MQVATMYNTYIQIILATFANKEERHASDTYRFIQDYNHRECHESRSKNKLPHKILQDRRVKTYHQAFSFCSHQRPLHSFTNQVMQHIKYQIKELI